MNIALVKDGENICPQLGEPNNSLPRILLADHNCDRREYIKRVLSEHYQVEAVADGLAAWAIIKEQIPDLVLTDTIIPELNGWELIREIRANPQTKNIAVILLFSRVGEDSYSQGIEMGADDYLFQPFSHRELLARVGIHLKMAHLHREGIKREKAAHTASKRLVKVLESITDGFYAFDHKWRFTYVNKAAEEMMEMRREQLLGRSFWEVYPFAIGTLFYQEVHRAVAEKVAVHFDAPSADSDRWHEVHAYPSGDGLAVYWREITERKRSEEVLRQTNQTLQALVQACPLGIMVLDMNGNVVMWNPAAQEIFGWETSEVIGYPLPKISGLERDYYGLLTAEIFQPQAISNIEKLLPKKDGTLFDASIATAPLRDFQGNIYSVMAIVADITERKIAEAERSKLLSCEQTARQEAETANRIKDEFLATLSHELRSPLNSILGWSELLRTRNFDTTMRDRALETIKRNAQAQKQLIDDLLDMSRIIQGKIRLNIRPVNLVSVIENAINTVRPAAMAKTITIEAAIASSMRTISGDTDRLQQIIWNLLSNAIKFTSQNGRVLLKLEYVNSHAEITVTDTGKGISPQFLPYVFERFRQADSSITRTYGGLGLGLAIVRHLVELHGGTVKATSPGEGQGSTFVINLPFTYVETQEHNSNSSPVMTVNAHELQLDEYPDLSGLRVLVVDDEQDTRDFLLTVVEQCHAEVKGVASVSHALAAIKQQKPHVLVSDIGMPVEDGYSLIRQVRAWELDQATPPILAIALTAYAREQDRKKALSAGFQRHLAKPIVPVELAVAIANLVADQKING